MQADDAERSSLQTQYAAAVAEERAFWQKVHDVSLHPVERLKAYAAWLAAAKRASSLALKLHPPPPNAPPAGAPGCN